MERKKIAVVYGGFSGEFEVSVKSARFVLENMDTEMYDPYSIEISRQGWLVHHKGEKYQVDKNDFSFQGPEGKITFDLAFIVIHGPPGEDGQLQGYFDLLGIPYTTGGVLNVSLTFNKAFCKEVLKSYGVDHADYVMLTKEEKGMEEKVLDRIGVPCFVKPNRGGSSLGNSMVRERQDLGDALESAFEIDDEILVEELIEGTELGCGVMTYQGEVTPLPVIEIISHNDFFDYEAKYFSKETEEITPARIPDGLYKECQDISRMIYDRLHCKGMIRVDFFLKEGRLYVIEVNTVPGLSDASLFPQEAEALGMTFPDMVHNVIQDGLRNS